MDIVQLKYFVAVSENGSFSEAAASMFSAQSTVSKQIASLEKELNTQLFDRSKRKVTLTEYGKVFLSHAYTILEDYNCMVKELDNLSNQDDSTVRICATAAMLPYNILGMISDFKKANPWVNVVVEEFETEDILKMLRESECDLAFFRVGNFNDDLYEKTPILTEKFVAVLPAGHPLLQYKSAVDKLPIYTLRKENFILGRKDSGLYRNSVAACVSSGFDPNVIATSNRTSNILEMVAMNMGISLQLKQASEYALNEKFAGRVELVDLEESFCIEVAAARHKKHHHNKASKALWEYIKENCNEI